MSKEANKDVGIMICTANLATAMRCTEQAQALGGLSKREQMCLLAAEALYCAKACGVVDPIREAQTLMQQAGKGVRKQFRRTPLEPLLQRPEGKP